ncbi:MAG: hypothetical protein HYX88_02830 [Chloroflexi bacterium]|nr:hypothetical protein [Chloroflexota bacterium]
MATSSFSLRKIREQLPWYRSLPSLFPMAFTILGLVSLLLLVQLSGVAANAYELRRLEEQKVFWQDKSYQTEAQIAYLRSVQRIWEEAVRQGMVPAQDPLFISVPKTAPATDGEPGLLPSPRSKPGEPPVWWRELLGILMQVRRVKA